MDVLSQYKAQIQAFPDFTREPQLTAELVEKMKANDKAAKTALFESTLKYVLRIATFHCQKEKSWPELFDLVQEANHRILRRIEAYDPKKGPLKAFVWMCTNTAFSDYMSRSGIVASSRYARRMEKHIQQARLRLTEQLGREPTEKELSEHLDIDEVRLRRLRNSAVRGFIDLDGPADEESRKVSDNLRSKATSTHERILTAAQADEIRKIAVECLGKRDADLWIAYKEGHTEYFYDLYFQLTGKGKVAARQFITRRTKKLIAHIERKTKHSALGGNHERTARFG